MHAPKPARFVDTWASVHFDTLRAVAALLVLFEHLRNVFFVDYPAITAHRAVLAVPYVLSGAGHQSVVLFFVLSGYFIGGTVLRSLERDQWQWPGYLLKRFVRLWIVLIPTLLLCLFWDRLGIHLGHAPALYTGHVPNHMIGDIPTLLTTPIFFGNLFFLQTIFTPAFGTDGALWSLAYEFWYYILFPVGLLALWPRLQLPKRFIYAALFVAVAWLVHPAILRGFPMWLAGVLLFKLTPPTFTASAGRTIRFAATVVYFASFFLLSRLHQLPGLVNDYILTLLTLVYLWLLLSHREPSPVNLLTVKASREAARFSFTLYAAHTPIIVFLAASILGDTRWYPSPLHFILLLCLLLGIVAYTYALAWLTEFRTDTLRSRLERLLGLHTTPSALPSNPLAQL